jgi:hypothetical protein
MPGDDRSQTPIKDKELKYGEAVVHMIYCVNGRAGDPEHSCPWYNTSWSVQVNPDGSIPPPQNHRGQPKKYGDLVTPEQTKRLVDNLQRQLDAEVEENSEIRRPGGR